MHEELEARLVPALIGAPTPVPPAAIPSFSISPLGTATPAGGGSGSPVGYRPEQIRSAYGFDRVTFGSIAGNGAGQTIAIVVAYDDPGLVDSAAAHFSTSDLAAFDRQFGLPDPPSFTKLNQNGGTTGLPGTDPAGPGSSSGNWEYEAAMDVEWAHALAPLASIVLVEANSNNGDDLYAATATAAGLPGVSTVSLSWGSPESSDETSSDRDFQRPAGHQGVTFVAATGDGGAPGTYPAFSPNVLAAGGTTLSLSSNGSYRSETAWSSSGGGISSYEPEPAFQDGVQGTGHRTIPDVAFEADRSIGVAVYDSYDNTGGGPWQVMGGTSLAAPAWAALIAVADQGRVAEGGTTLDGATQTLPALYSLPPADFHDVTAGGNGTLSAGPGYDKVTGLGTPVANLLIPDLAFYGMADHLVVTTQPPSSANAGSPFGLTVEVESPDGSLVTGASGTVTVSLANDPGGGSLGGSLTVTIEQGIATFSGLNIDKAGAGYALNVNAAGLVPATSSPFNVVSAAPAVLVITSGPPSSLTAGSGFGLTVDVEDAYGNLVTGYGSEVTVGLAGGPGDAALGGTLGVAAAGGVARFSDLTIDAAATGYAIQAVSGALAPGTTSAFGVTPAAPAQLVITAAPPPDLTAGETFGLTVSVEDAYGNLETGYAGDVTLGLSGGPAGSSLGGPSTVTAIGGVATFSGLTLDEGGSRYALQATSTGLTSATTSDIAVAPAAPARLVVSTQPPASITAGIGFELGVTVEDAFGNVETGFTGKLSVSLSQGPAGGSLTGDTTVVARQGVGSFSGLALDKAAGGYAIRVAGDGVVSVSASRFQVVPASPSQLVVIAEPPNGLIAGQSFGLTAVAEDAFGNVAGTFDGTVTLSLANGSPSGSLSGVTSTTAVNGVAAFTGLAMDRAGGGYQLAASSGGLASGSSNVVAVTPAAPARLIVVTQPSGIVVRKTPFVVGVEAVDAYGNLATAFDGTVTAALASNPNQNKLAGTLSVRASDGQAVITDATLRKTGKSYAITITSSGLTPVATSAFRVSRPEASGLAAAIHRAKVSRPGTHRHDVRLAARDRR
jgi:hypothetical protein